MTEFEGSGFSQPSMLSSNIMLSTSRQMSLNILTASISCVQSPPPALVNLIRFWKKSSINYMKQAILKSLKDK